jgi:hypothetical protein
MNTRLDTAKDELVGDYGVVWLVLGFLSAVALPTLGGVLLSPPIADAVLETYVTDYSLRVQVAPFVRAACAVVMFGMVLWLQENIGHRADS